MRARPSARGVGGLGRRRRRGGRSAAPATRAVVGDGRRGARRGVAGDLREQRVPQRRRRRDVGDVVGEQRGGRGIRCHVMLPLRMLSTRGLESSLVVGRQRVERVAGRQFGELLLVHDVTPISTRRRDKPSRILVLIVPSGAPTSAAISL